MHGTMNNIQKVLGLKYPTANFKKYWSIIRKSYICKRHTLFFLQQLISKVQHAFTFLNSTIETREKGVKHVQNWWERYPNDVIDVEHYFLTYCPVLSDSIVDNELVNVCWVTIDLKNRIKLINWTISLLHNISR